MAKYVGKRVVPKHCGAWSKNKEYEMLSIVLDEASGESYISRRVVPVGTLLTDEYYWSICSLFSQQIADMGEEFEERQNQITQNNANTLAAIRQDNDATEQAIRQDNDATEQAVKDDNTATKQHVDQAVARSLADMEEAVSNINDTNAALTARMNGIAGQATTDTEILDARTDADGTIHANLGEHIRKADEDIQNIFDYGEVLVSVPDEIRQKNLIQVKDSSVNGTGGVTICRVSSIGKSDEARAVVNGVLGEDYGANTLRFTEPLTLEAGKTYTLFLDDLKRTGNANIYFYGVSGGVMRENGSNRSFSLLYCSVQTFVPDESGDYVAGLYSHGSNFEDYKFRLYVLEGTYTDSDFLTYIPYSEMREELTALGNVSDLAREKNIIRMRSGVARNGDGDVVIEGRKAGYFDPGAIIINGSLGTGSTILRLSEDLELEQGETYTLYADDGGTGKIYSILLANAAGAGMRINDVVLYFHMEENPYGQFVVPDDQTYHVRIHSNYVIDFEEQPLRVYLLKGAVPLEQIRSHMGYEEGRRKEAISSANIATEVMVRDEIRKQSLLSMVTRVSYDTKGDIYITSTGDADADKTMVSFNGYIGDSIQRTTHYFSDFASFEAGQEYTIFALDQKQTVDYSIYFYKRGGGAMQQDGVNLGRSVINYPLWYITPDEGGEYRAGIYCHDGTFVNHPLRLIVLKGHYTLQDIRSGITFEEYKETLLSMALVQPEVLKENLVISRLNNAWSADGEKLFSCTPMNRLDNAGMVLNGVLGPAVEKNNVILSEAIELEAGEAYTFYMDSDKSLDYQMWFGKATDSTTITMNGQAVNFNAVTMPYGSFVPDTSDAVFLRIRVPRDMSFEAQKIHVYLLKGQKALKDIVGVVTARNLEETAGVLREELAEEARRTETDAESFNSHSIKAQSICDAIRARNLIKMMPLEKKNISGEVVLTCVPIGRNDPAGCVVNGTLSAAEGHSVIQMSDYFDLEAGETYTVFLDSSDQSVAYSMYFYTPSGVALQQGGVNRGISVRSEPFSYLIPDTGGSYRVGLYASNAILDHQEIHAYVVKGRFDRSEFMGMASGTQIADSVSDMVRVKDWVRRKNLVTCGSRAQSEATGTYSIKAAPVGAHDRAGAVLDGDLGSEVGMPTFRYSEPFFMEAGKTYTVLITDEDPEAMFQVYFVNYPAMTAMRQDGSVHYFHVRNKRYGFITPEEDGYIQATLQLTGHEAFSHHVFHFYVLEGIYGENEMMADSSGTKDLDYEAFGLPVLKLTGSMEGVTKDVTGKFDYIYGDLSGSCTMKWQGGSSLSYPKKNFTVKFDQKFEAKEGWGQRKKYVLKANYIDFSHARNIVCARLWGQIVKSRTVRNERLYPYPNGGAIDGFPCIMLLNGEFYGLYTLNTPKDEDLFGIGESTVDPETGEETLLPQAVFCADTHATSTQFKGHAIVDESDFSYKYVPDEEDFQWAVDSLNNLIDACLAADSEEAVDALADKVDLDSAVDYYLFVCLLGGSDMTDKNYIISTYDGVKWFFTAYDMDSVFGNHWTGKYYNKATMSPTVKSYANGHQLMYLLRKYKRPLLKARYAELRAGVMSEENVAFTFENFMVDIPRAIQNKEVERWPLIPGTNTNNLSQILDWYRLRVQALDAEIEAL